MLTVSNYLKYGDNKYVGEVLNISTGSITLRDGKIGEETLMIWESTRLHTLGAGWGDIRAWDNVMIISSRSGAVLRADMIRVLRNNPKGKDIK